MFDLKRPILISIHVAIIWSEISICDTDSRTQIPSKSSSQAMHTVEGATIYTHRRLFET
jgi:hypothetical protein